jgi:hypothetical protein
VEHGTSGRGGPQPFSPAEQENVNGKYEKDNTRNGQFGSATDDRIWRPGHSGFDDRSGREEG